MDIVLCYKINSKDGKLVQLSKEELDPYVADLKLLNNKLESHQVSFKPILLNPEHSNSNLSTLPISLYSANKCSRCCPERDNIEIPSSWIIYSRIFCRGDLEHGGRFNARIQSFPRKWRRNIWIDGQPTVELDIKGCQPRMLYHLQGKDYRDDPYLIEENYTDEQRDCAKTAMQYLLNEPVEQRAKWGARALTKQTDETGEVFFTDYYLPEKLIAKHQPIAHQFYGDVGVKLQIIESDIAYMVKTDLLSLGYGIVGIHDSFIVPESAQDMLYQSVMDRYFERVGFYPVIKQEY